VHLTKTDKRKYDFLIIGQGLAGSILSLSLISAGYSVLVIDSPKLSHCSRVAAGIWNPIVFKRLTKSWLADVLVPELNLFYEHWENIFQTTLIQQRKIIKPFSEEQEKNLWQKKAIDSDNCNTFLDSNVYTNLHLTSNKTIASYSKVLHAGNLDVLSFLEHTKAYLEMKQSFTETEFDIKNLNVKPDGINYVNYDATYIIFCDGHLVSKNPYFNWVPMKPAKGETFIIRCEDLLLKQDILNKGFFIMPLGNNLFKVGATYEWNELNDDPTEHGKTELVTKIKTMITEPFEIIAHEAGIRPSVIDRRPIIGNHPEHKNLYIFNGMGTKGVMIAPYFAKHLTRHFTLHSAIDSEVDVQRFVKK